MPAGAFCAFVRLLALCSLFYPLFGTRRETEAKVAVCNARSPNHSGRPLLSDFRSAQKVMISVTQGIAYRKGEIVIFRPVR